MDSEFVLLSRWSRQDRLALAVVILAIGFLTGTAIVMTATADQTTAIAGNLKPGGSAAPAAASGG